MEKGGLTCLLKAMRTHAQDALVIEKLCATLRNLSAHGTSQWIRVGGRHGGD